LLMGGTNFGLVEPIECSADHMRESCLHSSQIWDHYLYLSPNLTGQKVDGGLTLDRRNLSQFGRR
jgi:hypothetical protein